MSESNDINDFPNFKNLEKQQFYSIYMKFIDNVKEILDRIKIDKSKVYITDPMDVNAPIRDIVGRVEKRKIYFHIFHKLKMDELNETSFYCFWILKLQPFKHRDENFNNNKLNVDIAVYFLLQTAFKYIESHSNLTVGITQEALLNILYAFQYHDLSKEAIMALARNLVVYR